MVCPELIQAIMDAGDDIFTEVYVAIHCIVVMQVISFGVDIDCKLVLGRMQGIKEKLCPASIPLSTEFWLYLSLVCLPCGQNHRDCRPSYMWYQTGTGQVE